jgi:hypothetical protein
MRAASSPWDEMRGQQRGMEGANVKRARIAHHPPNKHQHYFKTLLLTKCDWDYHTRAPSCMLGVARLMKTNSVKLVTVQL